MTDKPLATPEALAELVARVAAAPDDVLALAELVRVAYALDEHELALRGLNRLVRRLPDQPRLLMNRAQVLRDLSRPEEALVDLDAVLAIEPDHRDARLERADLREEQDDLKGAADDLDWLVWRSPDDASLRWSRAEVRLHLGRNAEAFEDFDVMVALEPDAPNLRRRAEVLGENGRYAEAEEDLARAFALDPDPARNEIGWLQLMQSAIQARALGAAEQALTRALSLSPQAALLLMRARLRTLTGQPELAKADREAALALDPDEVARLNELADKDDVEEDDDEDDRFFAEVGMNAEAFESLAHAMDLAGSSRAKADPDAWLDALTTVGMPGLAGHFYRARAATNAERLDVAEAELEQALVLAPDNPMAAKEYAWVATRLGDTDRAAGDDARAEARYDRALAVIRRVPDAAMDRRARLMLAGLLGRNERFDEAEALLACLIADEPEDVDGYLVRGGVRRHAEREDQWPDFERAAALGSEQAKALLAQRPAARNLQ